MAWLATASLASGALICSQTGVALAAVDGLPGSTTLAQRRGSAPLAQPLPHSPYPLGSGSTLPLSALAVCPASMATFIRDSSTRAVPFSVATRSCSCYAEERANGATHDQSARRCFP